MIQASYYPALNTTIFERSQKQLLPFYFQSDRHWVRPQETVPPFRPTSLLKVRVYRWPSRPHFNKGAGYITNQPTILNQQSNK